MSEESMALFRFQFIAPLIHLDRGDKESYIQKLAGRQVTAPNGREYVLNRASILRWLKEYKKSGMKGLRPTVRKDKGSLKNLCPEIAQTLILLKQEKPKLTVDSLIRQVRLQGLVPDNSHLPRATVYRLLRREGLMNLKAGPKVDRLRFEAEAPLDLVQADVMHGPRLPDKKKAYLIAIIDDHSRLILHAEFRISEAEANFIVVLQKALRKRGLPRKVYVDNGSTFRSRRLAYALASLGVSLIHSTPYQPQGKGKCERWFRTIRSNFLPQVPLAAHQSLETLNQELWQWIEGYYHQKIHSSTGQAPLERFIQNLHASRPAPQDLEAVFRQRVLRKVGKDRAIALHGRAFEAPPGCIGKRLELHYDPDEPEQVEAFENRQSLGFLKPMLIHSNAKIKRNKTQNLDMDIDTSQSKIKPRSGKVPFKH